MGLLVNVIRGINGFTNALLQQAGMVFSQLTADPTVATGVVGFWYRSDLDKMRIQNAAGVINNVATEAFVGANAVPPTLTITAGTGLTGGGALSANRTLALATGAAAANLGTGSTSPAGNTHTVAAGSGATVHVDSTFDGGTGSTAYTVGDLVAILKAGGIIKA